MLPPDGVLGSWRRFGAGWRHLNAAVPTSRVFPSHSPELNSLSPGRRLRPRGGQPFVYTPNSFKRSEHRAARSTAHGTATRC